MYPSNNGIYLYFFFLQDEVAVEAKVMDPDPVNKQVNANV
jgi:hypothetical protein